MARTTPYYIQNKTIGVHYLGGLRFAHNESKAIDKYIHNQHKDEIEKLLDRGLFVVVDKEEAKASKDSSSDGQDGEQKEKSIIAQYSAGEINWSRASSLLGKVENLAELQALYEEGVTLGVPTDSAVMGGLRATIEHLQARAGISPEGDETNGDGDDKPPADKKEETV